jgi:hypothetical protein
MPSTAYQTHQLRTFSLATDFSKQIGIPLTGAVSQVDKLLPELQSATSDIREAHAELGKAVETLGEASGAIAAAFVATQVTNTFDRINDLSRGFLVSLEHARAVKEVLGGYKEDVESILASGMQIRAVLMQRRFIYQTGTGPQRHMVDSCADLRRFDNQLAGVSRHIQRGVQEMFSMRQTLDYYGTNAGKRHRKKTKELMTGTINAISYTMGALTSVMRSSWIGIIRRYIDGANESNCGLTGGTKYIGPHTAEGYRDRSSYVPMTATDHANTCHGLNKLSGLMRRMAPVEGLTWTQYRQRWNRWSNDKKERQILLALKRVRKQLSNLKNRDIPDARADFVNAFRGMSKAVGRSGPGVGLSTSDIKEFGPIPKALVALNDALGRATRLRMQAARAEPLMTAFSNPANVSCQTGGGYSGIFGGDDGEPLSPLVVVGGGLVAGLAVAHFLPNLLR